jgi:hypothetical protein
MLYFGSLLDNEISKPGPSARFSGLTFIEQLATNQMAFTRAAPIIKLINSRTKKFMSFMFASFDVF